MGGKLAALTEAATAGLLHQDSELGQESVPREGSATAQYLTTGKKNQMSVIGSINSHGHSKRRTRTMVHFQSLGLGSNESWLLPVEWEAD